MYLKTLFHRTAFIGFFKHLIPDNSMSTRHSTDSSRVQAPGPSPLPFLVPSKGCMPSRLITELGSSGLVDKIVIAQQSLQAFIDTLSPGAYASITKINSRSWTIAHLSHWGYMGRKRRS
ncbi:hypothetical protein BJV77DRAFT_167558 [Russula vinacea]|nr:hypothetical protein BJV77DRAFT_167558 [Russula vinacea]